MRVRWTNWSFSDVGGKRALDVDDIAKSPLPPRKFIKRVEGSNDLAELQRWFDAALTTHDWESFAKTVNGSA
jgi:hypothetical protein